MQNTKTFRLFISSTFNDFRREREVLQTEVFPHIKEYCSKKGYVFQPIDLRWGINEEAQLDQKTLELCLDEVRSCKSYPYPNFLLMLGDRYGWVPLPYAIESKEFETILAHVTDEEKKLLLSWYREDLNQLPASYILKERSGEYTDFGKWGEVEESIRSILQNTVKQTSLKQEQQRKYFLSATEAEIEEGIIPYINPTAYQRKLLKENPELEKVDPEHIFGFFRELDDDLDEENIFIGYDVTSARELKQRVQLELPEKNILTASTHKVDNVHLDEEYIDEFKRKIILFLEEKVNEQRNIERQFTSLDIELLSQEAFARNKRVYFVGQEALRSKVKDYLINDDRRPFVIYGKSGQGKSSLMAKLIEESKQEVSKKIYFRFVGATAYASSVKEIFISLFDEMNIDTNSIIDEDNFEKVSYKIEDKLLEIKENIVIFIDAVDQFGHDDQFLWLPKQLPNNMKIILSALEDESYKEDSKYFKVLKIKTDNIHKILPFESMNYLLYALLKEENRTVQVHQEKYFLEQGKNVSSPLYVKVATQEIKHWKSFDSVEHMKSSVDVKTQDLQNTQKGIIEEFILNLHTFYHHDKELVRRVLGYIYASSTGLSESELIELLSADRVFVEIVAPNTFHENKEKTLPVILWTRLYMQIKPFLSLKKEGKEELFYFFHREFELVISEYKEQKRIHYQFIKDIENIILQRNHDNYNVSRWGSLHITAIVEYLFRYKEKKEIEKEMNFVFSLDEDWVLSYLKELNTIGAKKSSYHKIKKSIIYFEYAIHIGKRYESHNSGDGILEYLKTLEKLSTIYWNLSKEDNAMFLKKYYVNLTEKLYKSNSNNSEYAKHYAKAMYQLSVPYKTIGKFKDERKLREETFKICKLLYEKDKNKWANFYANSLINLAASYKRGRRYKEAIELGEEAITIREGLYKQDPKKWANRYAGAFQETAILYKAKGDVDVSIRYVEKSISIRKKLFHENPRKYVIGYTIGLSNLSIYYREIKNYDMALALEKECFKIREEYYIENPDRWSGYFAGIHSQLGRTYRAKNELDKAIKYFETSLKMRKYIYDKAPNKWAKSYSDVLGTLANTYKQNKEYEKALKIGLDSLIIRKELYEKYKANRARVYALSLNLVAEIYIEMNNKIEAYNYAKSSYVLRKKYFNKFNTTKWKKYYASGLLTLSKTINNENKSIELLEESVSLREELYTEKGDKRKEFYIRGLDELSKLYGKAGLLEKQASIEVKLKTLKDSTKTR